MKEIKSPKKPLIFYYGIVLLLIVLFNLIISPILMERQVMQVDYGTFMKMIEEKNIGEVEVGNSEIVFTDNTPDCVTFATVVMTLISRSACTTPGRRLPRRLKRQRLRL